jgi:hypothetical protein
MTLAREVATTNQKGTGVGIGTINTRGKAVLNTKTNINEKKAPQGIVKEEKITDKKNTQDHLASIHIKLKESGMKALEV